MKVYEDLARLKVNEAIQRGLQAQRYRAPQPSMKVRAPDPSAVFLQSGVLAPAAQGQSGRRWFEALLPAAGGRVVGAVWLWAMALLAGK